MIEFKRILCPTDLSESSMRALAHAAALARWYDGSLTVLNVVPTFDPMPVRWGMGENVQMVYPAPRDEVLAEVGRCG